MSLTSTYNRIKRQKSLEPRSYEDALSRPSSTVWPGCRDGRCMPCGRIHDFSYSAYCGPNRKETVHRFRCWQNHTNGCPSDKPEPMHSYENSRCTQCGRTEPWVSPDGDKFTTLAEAKRAGFKRKQLVREHEYIECIS